MRLIGTIRREALAITCQVVQEWGVPEVAVACSGLFTIERALSNWGVRAHSCDVLMVSEYWGVYAATGDAPPVRVRLDGYEWLEEYCATPIDRVATVLLSEKLFFRWGRDNPYYERIRKETQAKWSELHARTVEWLERNTPPLLSYQSRDAAQWVRDLPSTIPVIAYPPFSSGGRYYGTFFHAYRAIESVFEWTPPPYEYLEGETISGFWRAVAQRKRWLFWHDRWLPEWGDALIGIVQPTPRAPTIYLYGTSNRRAYIAPPKAHGVDGWKVWSEADGADELTVRVVKPSLFDAYRYRYLNPQIAPGQANWYFGVWLNGGLIGFFAYAPQKYRLAEKGGNLLYLLSDFAVANGRYVSKLVLYAALSEEVRRYCQNRLGKPLHGVATTAFTKRSVSMKYRGLFELVKRTATDDGEYELMYYAPFRGHTLKEALGEWKTRYWKG